MKKFKFRLERVLEYRDSVKDERRRELFLANQNLLTQEERLEELQCAAAGNRLEEGLLSADMVELYGVYACYLEEAINRQKEAIATAGEIAEQARLTYIEAAKEAEALHVLKRRRHEEYRDYVEKEEIKTVDELAVQRGNHMLSQKGEVK